MTKLARYLKPYILPILLCVALLFVQANADLNLPNYMSDIVNVGIQQGGVEHSYPEAISADGLALMETFLTGEDRALAERVYAPVEEGTPEWESLKKDYPALSGTVYTAGRLNAQDSAALNAAFGRAGYAMVLLMQDLAGAAGETAQPAGDSASFDLTQLYPMLPMLAAQQQAVDRAVAAAAAAPEQTTSSTGALFARSFLAELGADTAALQSRYVMKTGGKMLLVSLIGAAASILVGLLAARIGAGAARTLRGDVFSKVSRFTNQEFDRFSTASLITRTTNDITQMQMLITMGPVSYTHLRSVRPVPAFDSRIETTGRGKTLQNCTAFLQEIFTCTPRRPAAAPKRSSANAAFSSAPSLRRPRKTPARRFSGPQKRPRPLRRPDGRVPRIVIFFRFHYYIDCQSKIRAPRSKRRGPGWQRADSAGTICTIPPT